MAIKISDKKEEIKAGRPATGPLRFSERKDMDEMKLKLSKGLMRNVVTRMISKAVYEKLGYKITVEINEIGLTDSDGRVRLHLDASADMDDAEFMKLVKTVGLD